MSTFDNPFLLGFDQFEQALERISRTGSESYPPYNIEQINEDKLRITIAVAGFTMEELSIYLEQNQLVIRGKKNNDEEEDHFYLHRGIATRQFQRSFILSDDIEVISANIDNGLLHIHLKRIVSETMIQTIKIETVKQKDNKGLDKTINVETKKS